MKTDKNHPERPTFGWRRSEDTPIKEQPVFTPGDIIFIILFVALILWIFDFLVLRTMFGFGLGLDIASATIVFMLIGWMVFVAD